MSAESLKTISGYADSWWKIITILAAGTLMIYNVSSAWIQIKDTQRELKIFREEVRIENANRDDKSDKRFQRALDMYSELKKKNEELESETENHLISDAYNRGRVDAVLQMKK